MLCSIKKTVGVAFIVGGIAIGGGVFAKSGTNSNNSIPQLTDQMLKDVWGEKKDHMDQARNIYNSNISLPDVPIATANINSNEKPTIGEIIASQNQGPKSDPMIKYDTTPLIFISMSMPKSAINKMLEDAALYNARVVMRGVKGDNVKTGVKLIQEMIGARNVGISIDPVVFKMYEVDYVPTFVLPLEPVKECLKESCPTPKHVRAMGTVSLEYFFKQVERQGDRTEKERAKNALLGKV